MIKVICMCHDRAHFDYARIEVSDFAWIAAKIKFFQSLSLTATITVSVDGIRSLTIYVLSAGVEFEDESDAYLDLNDEIQHYVLREA